MGMGCRKRERRGEFWVATDALPGGPRHLFDERLNRLLDGAEFDTFVEHPDNELLREQLRR